MEAPETISSLPLPTQIPYKEEVKRKAIHLFALVVPLGMAVLGKMWSIYLLVPLATLAVSADILRVRSESFAGWIYRFFGSMMRSEERPPVGGPVTLNGSTWVLLSAALLVLVFPIRIAVPSFAMFMVSDAAAALVGRRWGRLHWGKNPRKVEGSLAFVVIGLGIMALFPSIVFWVGAVSVVAAALAEALPRPFNDNLRVPMVAATVIYLLERLVLGIDAGSGILAFGFAL
jgi:dolichol kinase